MTRTVILLLHRQWVFGLFFLPFFCLGFLGRSLVAVQSARGIIIDPGHGGIDGGCQDGRGNLEKDLNLAVALRLAAALEKTGCPVKLTRRDDRALGATYARDLDYRLAFARQNGARALVSLHANWYYDPGAEGAVAVIPPSSPESEALARSILARLKDLCHVKSEPIVMTDHRLLAAMPFPVVLLEMGFLSNPKEAARLQSADYREALARAVAQGILDHMGTAARPEAPAPPKPR